MDIPKITFCGFLGVFSDKLAPPNTNNQQPTDEDQSKHCYLQ
jgi:hypothetical protein